MSRPLCTSCSQALDYASVLCDKSTCCSCEMDRLRKPRDEWKYFLTVLRTAVGPDGLIHQRDVRPAVRGRIAPKTIATLWRRARTLHLVTEVGTERSNDVAGKNAGRHEPVYRWEKAS